MKFKPPIEFPDGRDGTSSWAAARWESDGGAWRVEIDQVLFGYRLHVWRRDDLPPPFASGAWSSYLLDYCMGTSQTAILLLPPMVMRVLQPHDERPDLPFAQDPVVAFVQKTFPAQRRKPLNNDPECWAALCALAGVPSLRGMDLEAGNHVPLAWGIAGITASVEEGASTRGS